MHKRIACVLIISYFLQGCASTRKSEKTSSTLPSANSAELARSANNSSGSSAEVYGPPAPPVEPSYGPVPVEVHSVVLVLGPGLGKGFAYIGVLRALKSANIPIGAIVATEMGSLIGALFAASANLNQFEWGLQKFKEDVFHERRSFFSRFKETASQGEALESQLRSVFDKKDFADLKIPMRIGVESQDTGKLIVLERGNLVQSIRAALADPGVFTPAKLEGMNIVSGAAKYPFLVSEAKKLGIGPVIVVDVLTESESAFASSELKEADLILRPDMHGIEPSDFQKRTESAYRGKSATEKNLAEIRRLVGIISDGPERSSKP